MQALIIILMRTLISLMLVLSNLIILMIRCEEGCGKCFYGAYNIYHNDSLICTKALPGYYIDKVESRY